VNRRSKLYDTKRLYSMMEEEEEGEGRIQEEK
jgi:hypothetical protein